ncbi:hypothetical protein DICVIV_08269 [Dictyocaulus viviparus]|uniref:Lebercilin domain-containing protein n=1 Tax=Dictyocaulus viviparus TaxID=29172 RepID=A0A0D8XTL0_DICVI|nr:hypothetical protein DICVIV_08269 [Dictyocaulus viviparus]
MNRGRSPRQEKLDDMREELLKAKKVNAQLILNNRILNTKLQRLTREARKHDQSQKTQYEGKASVNMESKTSTAVRSAKELRSATVIGDRLESAAPNVQELMREISAINIETITPHAHQDAELRELKEKNKRRLRMAKAYAEQNHKLKQRLKQMREQMFAQQNKQHQSSIAIATRENVGKNGSYNRALMERLNEAEMKMEYLRNENDKLKRNLEYLQARTDSYFLGNSSEKATESPNVALSIPQRAGEAVIIPPLDICRGSDSISSTERLSSRSSSNHVLGSNRQCEDEISMNVLLYVVVELAIAYSERQLILQELNDVQSC